MRRLVWICCICCLFFVVSQLSLAEAAEKKPFKGVGSFALSGIAGALVDQAYGALDAAVYINRTGGVGGRPFVLIAEDGRYDVAATMGIFNKYTQSEPPDELLYYCQYNTPALKAMQEKINNETKIPVLAGSMSALIFDDNVAKTSPYYFATGPDYGDQWGMVLKWIKDHHKKKTPPRCALHYYDNSTGRDPMEALDKYAKKFGVEIVMKEPFSPTTQTFAPAFLKFRKNKIEYILFWNWSAKTAIRWFKESKKYIPDIPSYGIHWNAALLYFILVGKDYDGHTCCAPYPIETEMDNKFVKIVTDMAKEKKRKVVLWNCYMQSWMMTLIPAFAGRQLVAEGKPLTRENLRDAIENLKGWDMLGMYGGRTLDYTSHKFSRARMVQADWSKKSLVPISKWVDIKEYLK